MSGKSNVIYWLERHGLPVSDEVVERIFRRAKTSDPAPTENEILECCQPAAATHTAPVDASAD